MNSFNPSILRKYVAPEFVFGEGALQLVSRYTNNLGGKKALIVTDEGVRAAGWTGQVEEVLLQAGITYVIFDRLTSNPKDHEVMEGAEFYQSQKCDVIIAVGGGSPMDCAKAIGIVSTNQRPILEMQGIDEVVIPGPPLICIPTTAGSSADVSQFAIITDAASQVKVAIISKALVPDIALIDPRTTTSMPADLTAAVGMDALSHAFEAYVSDASSPLTDLNALEAVHLLTGSLPGAIERPLDLHCRSQVMWGSLMAGLAFSNASLGLVHSMAHSLGGLLDLAHGQCNAILLEAVTDYNFDAVPEKYRRIGETMGVTFPTGPLSEQRAALVDFIHAFRERIGLNQHLSDLGVTREHLPHLVQTAYHDLCLVTNPVKPTKAEIGGLYERVL